MKSLLDGKHFIRNATGSKTVARIADSIVHVHGYEDAKKPVTRFKQNFLITYLHRAFPNSRIVKSSFSRSSLSPIVFLKAKTFERIARHFPLHYTFWNKRT